jgi:hypothetical protein
MARWVPAAVAFAPVLWTSIVSGGYFPTAWGWPAVAFLVLLGAATVAANRYELTRLDWIAIAALWAFAGWTALSGLWASGAGLPVELAELALVYAAGLTCFLAFSSRTSPEVVPIGVLCAVLPIAAYALATRLVPDHVGRYDPTSGGYLLAGTIGYWNGLGLLVAIGAIVALGLVAHAGDVRVRCAAGAALVLLVPTLYFTFSRGASAALVVGVIAGLALDPGRLRFSAAMLVSLPLPLAGAWLGSRSAALTKAGSSRAQAAHDGHRLLLALVVLALLNVAAVAALAWCERRFEVTARARRVYVGTLAAIAVVVVALAFVRIGDPVAFVGRATDAFKSDTAATGGNLNRRFVTLSSHGRSDYWSVAWREARAHPALGGGAGSFRQWWLRLRPAPLGALNAHNLYLETLAELGPLGLALLLVALAVPVVAAVRARARPLVPVAFGAYAAYLVHAAIDWDWQLPALTLAALACGAACIAAARAPGAGHPIPRGLRVGTVAVTVPLLAFVFVMQLGNKAVAGSDRAATRDDARAAAADARRARRWLPWSAEPRRLLGEAQLAQGNVEEARRSFREALDRDDADWSSWLDLALSTSGSERSHALAEAGRLNPKSPEIESLRGH